MAWCMVPTGVSRHPLEFPLMSFTGSCKRETRPNTGATLHSQLQSCRGKGVRKVFSEMWMGWYDDGWYMGEKVLMKWKGKIMLSYLYALCSIERKDNLQMIRKETEALLKAVCERSSAGTDGKLCVCRTWPRIAGLWQALLTTWSWLSVDILSLGTFHVARSISFDTFNQFHF